MPPMPSEPANIPIAKKSNKVGTPNLYEVLPAIMLIKSNTDPTSSIFSIVKSIMSVKFYLQKLSFLVNQCKNNPVAIFSNPWPLFSVKIFIASLLGHRSRIKERKKKHENHANSFILLTNSVSSITFPSSWSLVRNPVFILLSTEPICIHFSFSRDHFQFPVIITSF